MNRIQRLLERLKPSVEVVLSASPRSIRNAFWLCYARDELRLALAELAKKGFRPQGIVDGGAFRGNWTRVAKAVFPQSRVLMIEAQSAKERHLKEVCSDFDGTVEYAITLLGPEAKRDVTFYEMGTGSSLLPEVSDAPRVITKRDMETLDEILARRGIVPSLLKLDLQGAEIEALKGAQNILKRVEILLLEVSLVHYNFGSPLLDEVIDYLKAQGFILYDCRNLRRWRCGTLLQMDAFFVRNDSKWRSLDFRVNPLP